MEHELSQPGWRQYIEKHADGSVWQIQELAESLHGFLLHQYFKASKTAYDRGLPPPPLPPGLDEADTKEIVCVTRSESQVGVRWKGADGRVFESDETGMVYGVDSNGERIIDLTFRRHLRRTNKPTDT